jgi:hypothetical protein
VNVGKYMPLELDDCIILREVHIYRGGPLEILDRGGCGEVGGLTAWKNGQTASGGTRGKP